MQTINERFELKSSFVKGSTSVKIHFPKDYTLFTPKTHFKGMLLNKSSEVDRKIKLYLFRFSEFNGIFRFSPFHWFFFRHFFLFSRDGNNQFWWKTCPIKLLEISFHTLVSTHFPMNNPICDRPPHNASKWTWKIALNHQSLLQQLNEITIN